MRSGLGVIRRWAMSRSSRLVDADDLPVSSPRSALFSACLNVLPIAITSPTDFICVVSTGSAPGNFSNCHFGILTTT